MAESKRSNLIFRLILVLGVVLVAIWIVRIIADRTDETPMAELAPRSRELLAEGQLADITAAINNAHEFAGEPGYEQIDAPAPAENRRLAAWLATNDLTIDPNTARDGVLVDPWGRPLELITRDGRLIQLGSRGPDGQWAVGAGDDVLGPEIQPFAPAATTTAAGS